MKNHLYGLNFPETFLTSQFMPRPRIDRLLDQATRSRLVYVIAGAGYGKTLAVRHYVEKQPDTVVRWLQLTEGDNICSNYWEHLTHTVSSDNPELAAKLRELGFPETLARFKQFVEILKTTERPASKTFLVLDDFHLTNDKQAMTFVERCAHQQLPGACVIIISRKEPEINAVSLFAKGTAMIITEAELCFTEDEIAAFLRFRGIPFLTKNLSRYYDATKGWALAIQFLSLVLKKTPENLEFALSTVKQNIFKVFETEAFDDFPVHIQKIMAQLALVSDLPATPLYMLSGDISFIEKTPQLSSFIWFDSLNGDFRVHPLYLEFLHSKVHLLSDEEKLDTYRQAAQWCFEKSFYMDAVRYFAKSHQFERILETLLSYPFKLPHDTCAYFLDILENLNLEKDLVKDTANDSENDPYNKPDNKPDNDPVSEPDEDPAKKERSVRSFLFLKCFFIPILLVGTGRYDEAKERTFEVIREWEHSEETFALNLLYASYSNLAYIDMYTCTVTHQYNAPKYLQKSVEYFKQSSVPPVKVTGPFTVADIRSFACLVGEGAELKEFDLFLEAARQTASYVSETFHDMYYGYEDLVACEIAYHKKELDLAKKNAYQAILKAREKKQYSIEIIAAHYLLRVSMHEGNYLLLKEILKQLRNHLDNPSFWNRQLLYDLILGIFYSQIGLPSLTPQWLLMDERETNSEVRIPTRELIVSVGNYIALKKFDHALTVLNNSSPREPQERFLFGELYLSLMTAVAKIKTDDVTGAMEDFKRAYSLSFNGVFETPFIEMGKNLNALVAAAARDPDCGIPEEWLRIISRKTAIYVKKITVILNAFKREKNIEDPVLLSEREQEVLNDLSHGLSRDEIATNRHLSINTVHKLIQSLFIKLDANNSADAIRIAIEKKLLE